MNEKKLRARLRIITTITIVISLLLTFAGFGLFGYMLQSVHDAEHRQMQAESEEYRTRVLKQLDKTTQILTTLARAYEVSGIHNDPVRLQKSLGAVTSANDFVSILYMDRDGTGVMDTPGYGTWSGVTLADCSSSAATAIVQAMQGKNTISNMFDSRVYHEKLFAYAVPVYEGGQVVGVLAASDTLDIFKDIANGQTVMNTNRYIHVLNQNGDFLVRSGETLIPEQMDSVFDGPYLSDETKQNMRQALADGQSIFDEFVYDGEQCHFYLAPLGLNGWYLFCADRMWVSLQYSSRVLVTVGVMMVAMVIIFNALLYWGYWQLRRGQRNLVHIAYQDRLTDADNVLRFDLNAAELLKNGQPYSIAVLNVHHFQWINDFFGTGHGDAVLRYLKKLIQNMIREGELFCRDSADFFYLRLLDGDEASVAHRLQKLIDQAREDSLNYGDYSYDLSLYAGVAVNGDREQALLALQSIKNVHHVNIAFYNQSMHDEIRRKNTVESQMFAAIKNREFKLFLQPKFSLRTGQLTGAEALVRWQKPDGSYRFPGEFIPLFEANGFCLKLDMYMVEQVCIQLRFWLDSGITPIPISVNQSKRLFYDLNYPENLSRVLEQYDVPPSLVVLEILEGLASDDLDLLNHQIKILHAKGFRISMDDFGSGYSSLNLLYQLQIDEVKLDRGFLRNTTGEDRKRRQIILEHITGIAQQFGMTIVAEGVETQEDKTLVTDLNCDYGQGYFYEKPISTQDFNLRYMLPSE